MIGFLLVPLLIAGQDTSGKKKPKWEIAGYVKSLEAISFDKQFKDASDLNLIHNRINIKWKSENKFLVAAEFRNRFIWGKQVRQIPNYAATLKNNNELVDLQRAWINKPAYVLHTNVERMYGEYRGTDWNLRVGRQRINWGMTTTWNPNDIFNVYNFLDFDYEERPGVDGVKLQCLYTDWFNVDLAMAHTNGSEGTIAALRYFLNHYGYDMQAIMGWYNEHPTIGIGWAGSIRDAGFKGEIQYFVPPDDSAAHFNLSLETDYMSKKGWYVNAGFLFNKTGIHKPINDWKQVNLKLSPENPMPTRWNFIITTSKEFTPLFTANMSIVYSPGTNLMIVYPTAQYNIATNLDLSFIWQSFLASVQNKFQTVNHTAFLRLKWSF
jgi:hypothetical protein